MLLRRNNNAIANHRQWGYILIQKERTDRVDEFTSEVQQM